MSEVTDSVPTQQDDSAPNGIYRPRRDSSSEFLEIRGLRYHVRSWPGAGPTPKVVYLLHGWMDVSASYQFVADLLPDDWTLRAPDWRGFGLTQRGPSDSYWFPDYLADFDRLLDLFAARDGDAQPIDLVGHSMGGNIACQYAGIRPERVRRLVNLEGVAMTATRPDEAPGRYAKWLDSLRLGARLRDYGSHDEVAARLMRNNPRLRSDFARFLALYWSEPTAGGRLAPAGDPAHKLVNPILYRADEVLEIWRRIRADVIWALAEHPLLRHAAYVDESAYAARLSVITSLRRVTIADAGHMVHHDRPDAVAALIKEFMS